MQKLWRKLNKPKMDDRGSITIEFVIWFPVLMFWLVGTIVFFDAFKSRGNLTTANATVADIVSRNSVVSEDYITLLYNLQTGMLPRTTGNGLRISSINYSDAGNGSYSVEWSAAAGAFTEELEDGDIIVELMPDMYDAESILFIESSVPYVPLTAFLGVTFRTLTSEIAISPRYESQVVWVNP